MALWTTTAARATPAESGAPPWVAAASVGMEAEGTLGYGEGGKRRRSLIQREGDGEATSVSKIDSGATDL